MTGNRALGILETRGMAALMAATDAMLKRAEVRLCGRHGIGSGWVTVLIEGDTAAVNAAMRAGQAVVARHGELIAARVVPRPDGRATAPMPHGQASVEPAGGPLPAIGLLETKGVTPLIAGADAMVKAADVEIAGWAPIGGALLHLLVRGEVAAVQTALAAGGEAAEDAGDLFSTLAIPQPHAGLAALFPPPVTGPPRHAGALGVVETTGYAGAVAAADAMLKRADVGLQRLTIGSGGRVAILASGPLDVVQMAVPAGAEAAAEAAECNGSRVVTGPDSQVMAAFAQPEAPTAPRRPEHPREAMGLLETRSTVALVKALDEMLKAAEVQYEGRYKVGYFLTAAVIRGDVGAVKVALDRGAEEAQRHGELVAARLIPLPLPEMEERLPHA
ncbi:MAG: BMC domain-containing protein [Gemmatimonadota bacterium]